MSHSSSTTITRPSVNLHCLPFTSSSFLTHSSLVIAHFDMAHQPLEPPDQPRHPSKPRMANGRRKTEAAASTSPDRAASSHTPARVTRPPPPPRISPQYERGRTEYIHRERGAGYAFTLATNSYAVPGNGSIYVRHVQSTFATPIPSGQPVRVYSTHERPRSDRDISPLSLTRPMLEDEPPSNPVPRRRSPESRLRAPRSRGSASPTSVLERSRPRRPEISVLPASDPDPDSAVEMDVDQTEVANSSDSEGLVLTTDHLELTRVSYE